MALGAYSSAMYPYIGGRVADVPCTQYDVQFTSQYEIYILILNIVVSVIMLIIAVRLRLASHLGADFVNPTRLLLESLKKPELFNVSLKTTVDVLADPYILVEDSAFFARRAEIDKGEKETERKVCPGGTHLIEPRNES